MVKKIICGVVALFVISGIGAYFYVGNYFYNFALRRGTKWDSALDFKMPDIPIEEQNRTLQDKGDNAKLRERVELRRRQSFIRFAQARKWFEVSRYEDVYIRSYDELRVHAYKIEHSGSSRWVVFAHGYCADASDLFVEAKNFYERGYNVLLLDMRGHGKSDGNYMGMGWHDRLDIKEWVKYLVDNDKNCSIVLFGVSMGAAAVMMSVGEDLPNNVKVAIEDCGYTSIADEVNYLIGTMFGLPAWPIVTSASIVTKMRAGFFVGDGSCINQLKKSKTPILFIHGAADKFVPTRMVNELYDAACAPKEKLIIEEATHRISSQVNFDLYWKTVWEFVEKYV